MPCPGSRAAAADRQPRQVNTGRGEEPKAVEKKVAVQAPRKPEEQWKIPPRYQVREVLGKGSYGKVCEAYDSAEKRHVAIKKIANLFGERCDCKRILREIAIMSRLDHKNIVQIYDIPPPSDLLRFNELYIVMEVCDTDLKKLFREKVNLTPAHVDTLFYNLLLGLNYLHKAGVYHRDLTPGNCLVNQDLTVKICDFGLSRAVGAEVREEGAVGRKHSDNIERHLTAHVVTRWYRAPELILLQDDYTEAIDIWSAGCIYAELLGMLEGVRMSERGPLFPGRTCFPMSPDPEHESDYKFHTRGNDQLNVVFMLLGTPSEADIEKQHRADARKYLRRFEKHSGSSLKARLPHAPDESCDLLARMLRFNADERIPLAQAFNHKLFSVLEARDARKETVAPALVNLAFEGEKDLGEARLRGYLCEEMRKFHPEVPKI